MKVRTIVIFITLLLSFACEAYNKSDKKQNAGADEVIPSLDEHKEVILPLDKTKSTESKNEPNNSTTKNAGNQITTETKKEMGLPELLASLSFNVIWPNFDLYQNELTKLQLRSNEFCSNPSAEHLLEAAQQQWRKTMYAWQKFEMHKIGAASHNSSDYSFSQHIYFFNLRASPYFTFDEAMKVYAGANFNATKHNSNGLDAMEVLLFDHDPGPVCSEIFKKLPPSYLNATAEDQVNAKCSYINAVLADLQKNTQEIANRLDPSKSNYLRDFVLTSSPKESMQILFDELFNIESSVKDVKIGAPTGAIVSQNCNKPPCPCRVEHIYSKSSRESLEANIESFSELLEGKSNIKNQEPVVAVFGISDYLRSKNQSALAAELEEKVANVKKELNNLQETSLFTEIASLPKGACSIPENADRLACRIYQSIKSVTDLIKNGEQAGGKSEFLKTLDVELPQRASGDSD